MSALEDAVRAIVETYGPIEADFGGVTVRHSIYKRLRYKSVAEAAVSLLGGDLAEVGVRYGLTTALFAQVAALNNRRVLAVDSWEDVYAQDKQEFIERMKPWQDIVDVVEARSQSPTAIEALQRDLCLVFLDANEDYRGMMTDLETVKHAAVIIVDGIHDVPGRRLAWEKAGEFGTCITHPKLREGYIVTGEVHSEQSDADHTDT